jgi:hypothetical protein
MNLFLALMMLVLTGEVDSARAAAGSRHIDGSKELAYALPKGWKTIRAPRFAHDIILLPGESGINRNIIINEQPGDDELAELKDKYEQAMSKKLKNFQLIESELIELKNERRAVRIIHTNTNPGVPIRQINYILKVGDKHYFVACTVLKEDADRYDAAFENFVNSMTKPQPPATK